MNDFQPLSNEIKKAIREVPSRQIRGRLAAKIMFQLISDGCSRVVEDPTASVKISFRSSAPRSPRLGPRAYGCGLRRELTKSK